MTESCFEARVTVSQQHAELAESLMQSCGALAVTLSDRGGRPVLEPGVGETPLWDALCVTGLFAAEADPQRIRTLLSLLPLDAQSGVVIDRVADRRWERAWMDTFTAMRFGDRTWIVPSGQPQPEPPADILRLDPGLAFGTGTHPTTRLCLEWLDAAECSGRTVLDFGCGSGVLGLMAAIKGARRVWCVDNDPQALIATRENAARNDIEERVEVCTPEEAGDIRADVVLANILAGTLIELAEPLALAVRPLGSLVLSGILAEQAGEVARAYETGFPELASRQQEDWVMLYGNAPA